MRVSCSASASTLTCQAGAAGAEAEDAAGEGAAGGAALSGTASLARFSRPCASRARSSVSPSSVIAPKARRRASGCTSRSAMSRSFQPSSARPSRSAKASACACTRPLRRTTGGAPTGASKSSFSSVPMRPRSSRTGSAAGQWPSHGARSSCGSEKLACVRRCGANGRPCAWLSKRAPSSTKASRGATSISTCEGSVDRKGSVSVSSPSWWIRPVGRSSKCTEPPLRRRLCSAKRAGPCSGCGAGDGAASRAIRSSMS